MKIELTNEEKEEALEFIEDYKEISIEILDLEKKIEEFKELLDRNLLRLEDIRNKDKVLMKEFKDKYGNGKLDPFTLNWITY